MIHNGNRVRARQCEPTCSSISDLSCRRNASRSGRASSSRAASSSVTLRRRNGMLCGAAVLLSALD